MDTDRAQAREALAQACMEADRRWHGNIYEIVNALLSARYETPCETCMGGGYLFADPCFDCNGSGTVPRLALPEALDDQQLGECVAEASRRGLIDLVAVGRVPLYRQRETTSSQDQS